MKLSFSRDSVLLAIVIVALVAAVPFAVLEFLRTGEFYLLSHRLWPDLVARFHGPGRMRFILQPTVAIFFGVRDGLKDAHAGNPPFLWGLVFRGGDRSGLMRSAVASVRNLIAIAILLDVISQLLIFHIVHPGAALVLGPLLIGLPYASSRALMNRIARWRSESVTVTEADLGTK